MIRHAHSRVDENHKAIARGLRALGASVLSLAPLGKGAPDLLVGLRGKTFLLEVKRAEGKTNEVQDGWIASWRGHPVAVVRTLDEALEVIRGGPDRSLCPAARMALDSKGGKHGSH